MKLWLISQDKNNNYDTYDSAVVAAETEDAARKTHPSEFAVGYPWVRAWDPNDWVSSHEQVTAELIGEAVDGTPAGVILTSYYAG